MREKFKLLSAFYHIGKSIFLNGSASVRVKRETCLILLEMSLIGNTDVEISNTLFSLFSSFSDGKMQKNPNSKGITAF